MFNAFTNRLVEAQVQAKDYEREIRSLERELTQVQLMCTELTNTLATQTQEFERMSLVLASSEDTLATAKTEAFASGRAEVEHEILHFKNMYLSELTKRREIHNRLLEIQGNIRVFCRVRPIQDIERETELASEAVSFSDDQSLKLVVGDVSEDACAPKYDFEFDHVFPPTSTQDQVFCQTKALIVSAMDGYKVCIFAYGQTGSGS